MVDIITPNAFGRRAHGLRRRMPDDEQIDHVFAPLVDDRGHRFAGEVIEPAAKQRETFRGEVDYRRPDIDPAVEPRLDGMLVARLHIQQMIGLERAKVRRLQIVSNLLSLIIGNDAEDETCRNRGGQARAERESAEE